ncbi:LamG domain-containing protein, partial [Candidatus Woesearchaeota archaeon]|nr:LamG domain-containing protein [Candidatus Woesearchaeota archaeon]
MSRKSRRTTGRINQSLRDCGETKGGCQLLARLKEINNPAKRKLQWEFLPSSYKSAAELTATRTKVRVSPQSQNPSKLPSNSFGMKLFFALMVLFVLTLAVITVNPGTINVLTGAVIGFGIELPEDEIAIDLPLIKIPEEPTPETAKNEPEHSSEETEESSPSTTAKEPIRIDQNSSSSIIETQNIIISALPSVTALTLNTTNLGRNSTKDNLTAYSTTSDTDGDLVKVIYNWRRNNDSIAILNMPFEKINNTNDNNTWDYSGWNNNQNTENNSILWIATGGYNGSGGTSGAYKFNGTNQYLTIGYNSALDISQSEGLTISVWIKPDSLPNYGVIVTKGRTAGVDRPNYALRQGNGAGATGKMVFYYRNSADTAWNVYTSTNEVLATNTWQHVAMTYTMSSRNTIKLYVNGTEIPGSWGLATEGNDVPYASTEDLWVGAENTVGGAAVDDPFNGTIDELLIFNRSLTPEQIRLLYNNETDIIFGTETQMQQNWSVCATPNDGNADGAVVCSNTQLISNRLPTVTAFVLNSTDPTLNNTNQNLTAYPTASDADGDTIKQAYSWLLNGTTISKLIMPFEKINGTNTMNIWDYSGKGINGSEAGNAVWNSTGGYDGNGAYTFDGNDDYLNLAAGEIFEAAKPLSIVFWAKLMAYTDAYPEVIQVETDTATSFRMGFSNDVAGDYAGFWFGSNANFVQGRTTGDMSASFLGA